MKTVYNKVLIILLLIIMIIVILNLINKKQDIEESNIIPITPNHVNASFVSNEYLKNLKQNPDEITKYKLSSGINRSNDSYTNDFLSSETDFHINQPFIENFVSRDETQGPAFISKIDKILYINLDHRKDRLKQINGEFDKMDFPKEKIKRISAVHEKYNGHIGCCKSHIKVMDEIIKNNYKYTMVFEDDFIFSVDKQTLQQKISKFLSHYGDDWDMIQLASVYTTLNETDIEYIKDVKRASTSSAYIINGRFAKILRKDLKNSLRLMEKDMKEYIRKNNNVPKKKFETRYALDQNWYSLQKKSKWYLFKPYIGRQGGDAGGSSILNKNIEGFTSNYGVKLHSLMC